MRTTRSLCTPLNRETVIRKRIEKRWKLQYLNEGPHHKCTSEQIAIMRTKREVMEEEYIRKIDEKNKIYAQFTRTKLNYA